MRELVRTINGPNSKPHQTIPRLRTGLISPVPIAGHSIPILLFYTATMLSLLDMISTLAQATSSAASNSTLGGPNFLLPGRHHSSGRLFVETRRPTTTSTMMGVGVCLGFEHIFIALLLLILIIMTVVGNTLVMLSVFLYKRMRTFTNFLLTSLATADLLVGLLIMPLSLIDLLHKHQWPFGRLLCRIWATMDVLLCTASILNLCIISLDRYMAITSPLKYPRTRSRSMAIVRLGLVWGISVVVCSPPWFIPEWGLFFQPQGKGPQSRTQSVLICAYPSSRAYRLYSASVSFYIPLAVMLFVYFKIFRVASQREALMRANMGGTCRLSRRVEKQQRGKKYSLHANNIDLGHNRCASVPMQRTSDTMATSEVVEIPGRGTVPTTNCILQFPANEVGPQQNCLLTTPKRLPSGYRRQSYCPQPPPPLCRSETDDFSSIGGVEGVGEGQSAGSVGVKEEEEEPASSIVVLDSSDVENGTRERERDRGQDSVLVRRGMGRESRSLLNLCEDSAASTRKITDSSLSLSPSNPGLGLSIRQQLPRSVCGAGLGGGKMSHHSQPSHLNVVPTLRLLPHVGGGNKNGRLSTHPPQHRNSSAGCMFVTPNGAPPQHPHYPPAATRLQPTNLLAKAEQHYQANGPGKALRGSKEKIVYMRERKALKTIGIVVLGFIVCWMPFFVVYLLEVFLHGVSEVYGFQLLNEFFLWLGYSNSVLNPLIYALYNYNGHFRRCFRDLLSFGCLRRHRRTMSVKKLHQQSTAF